MILHSRTMEQELWRQLEETRAMKLERIQEPAKAKKPKPKAAAPEAAAKPKGEGGRARPKDAAAK